VRFLEGLAFLFDLIDMLASLVKWRDRRPSPDAAPRSSAQPGTPAGPPLPTQDAVYRQGTGVAGWAAPPPSAGASLVKAPGCLPTAGLVTGFLGPLLALLSVNGGDEGVIPFTVASCGLAGLLLATGLHGGRGAVIVLLIPLAWAVLLSGMLIAMRSGGYLAAPGDLIETAALAAAFVVVVAAGAEGGYVAGRLAARLNRGRA
jgi:hypothetical protein